jgi:hypothetical protein
MTQLNGYIETSMGVVVFTDGKIDTINGVPFEAGSYPSCRAVIKSIGDKLRNDLKELA